MKQNKFWKKYLNEAPASPGGWIDDEISGMVSATIQKQQQEERDQQEQERIERDQREQERQEQIEADNAARDQRRQNALDAREKYLSDLQKERDSNWLQRMEQNREKAERSDIASTNIGNVDETREYLQSLNVDFTPAELINVYSTLNINNSSSRREQNEAKQKLVNWLAQARQNRNEQIGFELVSDVDNVTGTYDSKVKPHTGPQHSPDPDVGYDPNMIDGRLDDFDDEVWGDFNRGEFLDQVASSGGSSRPPRRVAPVQDPNEFEEQQQTIDEDRRAEAERIAERNKKLGWGALGAAGLGAAAYAMRRLMLRRRAQKIQEESIKQQEQCDNLTGRERKECLDAIDDNTLKNVNVIIRDCANTDDPDQCEREIRSIISV